MLESDAKKKLCPFSFNDTVVNCLGSKCMGWDTFWDREIVDGNTVPKMMGPPQGQCGMKLNE